MNIPEKYWELLNEIVATGQIVIERPKGTSHPRYPELIYPIDYGYLTDTYSSDGDAVDAWVGSLNTNYISGVVCTVDTESRDVEVKILLGCTKEETNIILDIHNQGMQAAFFVKQPT